MDITYECMNIYLWLKFISMMDVVDYMGINPYIIVEMPNYVHAYMFDEVTQDVCHLSGHAK